MNNSNMTKLSSMRDFGKQNESVKCNSREPVLNKEHPSNFNEVKPKNLVRESILKK